MSTDFFLPVEGLDGRAVLGRICKIYGCKGPADLSRVLGITLKNASAYIARNAIPYPHIVEKIGPENWAYVFLGEGPPERSVALPDAIKAIQNAGGTVTFPPKV